MVGRPSTTVSTSGEPRPPYGRPRRLTQSASATRRACAPCDGLGYGTCFTVVASRAKPSSRGPARCCRCAHLLHSSRGQRSRRPAALDRRDDRRAMPRASRRTERASCSMGSVGAEYPTAPSMQISVFSPGFRMKRLGRATLQSIARSGMQSRRQGRASYACRSRFVARRAEMIRGRGPCDRDYHR